MNDIARAITLAVTDLPSAVDVLRGRLAHDWTNATPPELRDDYERAWAQAFIDRLTVLIIGGIAKEFAIEQSVARDNGHLAQAWAGLYAAEHGGYIAHDGDLDDDGAGYDILWCTVPTADGPVEVGLHLDDSGFLAGMSGRRGERRVVPDDDVVIATLRDAVAYRLQAGGGE
jgi:hypothetical protein